MNPDPTKEKEREREKLERRVEALAGEIADLINTSEGAERNDLRDLALSIVREEVRSGEESFQGAETSSSDRPFNPIVMAVPVFLMGALMVILFPPVGLFLFATSFLLVGWGAAVSLLFRRSRAR